MFFKTLNNFLNIAMSITLTIVFISVTICCAYLHHKEKQTLEVAKVICAEACSENNLVMFGVGSTIRNRMIQKNISAYAVVTEKNQYYGYTNINKNKIFENIKCKTTAIFIAKHINELPDMVNGGIYFRFKNEPKQSWHKKLTQIIEKAEFYQ